jgi:hypothetical protein
VRQILSLGVLRVERSEKGLLVGYPVIKED